MGCRLLLGMTVFVFSLTTSLFVPNDGLYAAEHGGQEHGGQGQATPVAQPSGTAEKGDIVETALSAGNFKTLAKALEVAGLVETLKGAGPYTVFAPSDEAFEDLPPGELDLLLADPEKLKEVLLYHVVSGKVMAKDVAGMTAATTLQGGQLQIDVDGTDVFINDAYVLKTDIESTNGIIHVIDTVLLPEEVEAAS